MTYISNLKRLRVLCQRPYKGGIYKFYYDVTMSWECVSRRKRMWEEARTFILHLNCMKAKFWNEFVLNDISIVIRLFLIDFISHSWIKAKKKLTKLKKSREVSVFSFFIFV